MAATHDVNASNHARSRWSLFNVRASNAEKHLDELERRVRDIVEWLDK